MYLWTAIDLDDQLPALREAAQAVAEANASCNHALSLPLHVSLRISFFINDAQADVVIHRIIALLAAQKPFTLQPSAIEQSGDRLIWLRIAESEALSRLHRQLVEGLQEEYGIPPHEFDLSFRYHASLFIGDCAGSADAAWRALKDLPYPESLRADTFVIGCSATGQAGDYRVLRRIYTCA